ncbi:MAG TPA: CBS domain-containing protein [Thermoanaerobaculia bacterium]
MAENRNQQSSSRNIRDLMTPSPECVSDQDSVRDAARIMKNEDTGVVPVVDGSRKIIGLITDRDIVVRGLAEGRDLENLRVNEIMTKQVRSVKEDASLDEVMTLMSQSDIRRVPVVNGKDEIVGIVSIGDIANKTDDRKSVGRTIEDISEAPPNN